MKELFRLIRAGVMGWLLILGQADMVHAQAAAQETLKLKMIAGTEQRRTATINSEVFLAGEKHTIVLGGRKVMVECVEIRAQSALVRIEGEAEPRELKLGEVEAGTFKSVINPVEVVFTNYNFAISVPGGWRLKDDAGSDVLTAYMSPDKTGFLILRVKETPNKFVQIDHRFVNELEKKLTDDGEEAPLSGTFKKIAGIDGYERVGRFLVEGQRVPTVMDIVAAEGKIYCVQMLRLNGHPDKDPEFQKCVASFRFLAPPVKPSASALLTPEFFGNVTYDIIGVLVIIAIIGAIVRRFTRSA